MASASLVVALDLARQELRAALSLVQQAGAILADTRANADGAFTLHKAVLRLSTATEAFAKASREYLKAQRTM